jgi:hypothetical protein
MKRRLNLPMMCNRADRCSSRFAAVGFDSSLHFSQVFRDKIEVRQRRCWDWLLVLARDFE